MKRTYGIAVGDRMYGVGDVIQIVSYREDDDGIVIATDADGDEFEVYTILESDSEIKIIY